MACFNGRMTGPLSERQMKLVESYLDPTSATYMDMKLSAQQAGYKTLKGFKSSRWMRDLLSYGKVTKGEVIEGIKKETKTVKSVDRLRAWELLGRSLGVFGGSDDGRAAITVNVTQFSQKPNVIEAYGTSHRTVQLESGSASVAGVEQAREVQGPGLAQAGAEDHAVRE